MDDPLSNILHLLDDQKNGGNSRNDDWQSVLLKMLLSGNLNNLFGGLKEKPTPVAPEPPRTINLENYKRLD